MQCSLVEEINYSFIVVGSSDFNRSETPYAPLKDEDVTEKFLELLTSPPPHHPTFFPSHSDGIRDMQQARPH